MNRLSIPNILLKSINCFYILLDRELNIKAGNEDYVSVFPQQTFETGKKFLNCFNNKYHEKFITGFTSLQQEKDSVSLVRAPIESEHNTLYIEWNICTRLDDDNTLLGFELIGVVPAPFSKEREIEARYNSENPSRPLFDFHSHPFFAFDLYGCFIKVNDAFANLVQYSETELLNTPFLSLVCNENLDDFKKFISEAVKGRPQEDSGLLNNKRGEKVSVHIVSTPIIENGVFAGVNAFVKKTSQKLPLEKSVNRDGKRLRLVLDKLKKISDFSLDMICTIDDAGRFTSVSAASKKILGYQPKELIGKNYLNYVFEEDIMRSISVTGSIKSGVETTNFENRFYKKDGSLAFLGWSSRWEENDKKFYCTARDASQKKASDEALKASEEKYRVLFHNHPIPSWIYDTVTFLILEVNEAAVKHYGYCRDEFLKMSLRDILSDEETDRFDLSESQKSFYYQNLKGLWVHKKRNNELSYAEVTSANINFQGRDAKLVLSVDRTKQTMAEQEVKKSNERYIFLSEATFDAIWDWDLKTNTVKWNESAKKMFGVSDLSILNRLNWWHDNLHDEDKERVESKLKTHITSHIPKWEDEYRLKTAGNTYKYIYDKGVIIYNENDEPVRMIGAMQDLTERKAHDNMLQDLNQSLKKRAAELAESNAELEKFAYVTSHDLQEPLRMVTSFLQLLEKRYKDKLDIKAHEYINYAVDGAERMKRLILDLLEYSRVNSSKAQLEDVDVNEVAEDLKIIYKSILLDTKGRINTEKLPVIKGNKTQILQLFQNLISNALKYRTDAPPVIDISFKEEKLFYKFKIRDNGIGIDPKFFHKIFIIFQRLHNRDEYSGTGIGLAICKKIIDKHGGKIGVTSDPGNGSTFYFTLPKS